MLSAPNAIFQDLATWEKIPFMYSSDTRNIVTNMRRLAVDKHLFARLEEVLEHELAHEMAFAVESGKIRLNKGISGDIKVDLSFVEPDLAAHFSNIDMEHSLFGHTERIKSCALETLAMAGVSTTDIDTVIFVGGSSLMSVIENAMTDIFPSAKQYHSEAFTAIVDGLAIATSRPD